MLHEETTGSIIEAFYKVYNRLGYGFLEKVYEKALFIELEERGLEPKRQYPIKVFYGSDCVGEYYADMLVANIVIVELKATQTISINHEVQLINYLKATELEVGLLLNFGRKPEFCRKIYSNNKKISEDH